MTAKNKARELVLKFAFKGAQHENEAKTFALIAVDEILDTVGTNYSINYWQEVKKEISIL